MGMRVLIAGIVGGIVLFLWGAVSHMALPLGEMGIDEMPNEAEVVDAMKQSITRHGLYAFPGMGGAEAELSDEQVQSWEEKYNEGPIGLLIYSPRGRPLMSPTQLATEFAFNALAVLLAAFIIARMTAGYVVRVLCFMLIGVIGWMSISTSYWNWYLFPTEYTIGELIMETLGWLLVGLVCAGIVKPGAQVATGA